MVGTVAATGDPVKLVDQNLALRAENRKLKAEARRMRARLKVLALRVDQLTERQADVSQIAERTEGVLRWLRARMEVLEREIERN